MDFSVCFAPLWLLTMANFSMSELFAQERPLTSAAHGHMLTNVNVWSPDSRWIVYDVRAADSVFDGARIEHVNVETGEVQRLYEAKHGAACGVATYHPREWKVVFIHGPENPTPEWSYGASRRRGAIVDVRMPGEARPLDAMNYAPPFTPGALRGGSHVHVFSPDGQQVSFTYEDEVLARLGPAGQGSDHDLNQRNIGVAFVAPNGAAAPGDGGVRVARTHPRNHDGDYFSVVVTRTVNFPRPGSDEISRAYEEGWVMGGERRRAIAFLGDVVAPNGRAHAEVFIVDLPRNLTLAGDAPLEGTATRRLAPPRGVTQRRLTFTSDRKHPGIATTPRHWLRASPDGALIAFLMKDDSGIVQLWSVSARGGEPRQITRNTTDIASAFTWRADARSIAHVMDGSVCVTDVATGQTRRLTERRTGAEAPLPYACVFSPDGEHIAFMRNVATGGATFAQIFIVPFSKP